MKFASLFVVKMLLWSVASVYVLLDLFVFTGPLKKELKKRNHSSETVVQRMDKEEIAAFIYRTPIYLTQVDYAVQQQLDKWNMELNQLPKGSLQVLRRNALDKLIDQALMRARLEGQDKKFIIEEKEIKAALTRFNKRFKNIKDRDKALKNAGIKGEKELKMRLHAALQQDLYLKTFVEKNILITEKMIADFYQKNKIQFTRQAQRQIRHVFLAHLDHPEQGEQKIKVIFAQLKNNKTLQNLAQEYNEDPKTKNNEGMLGWVAQDRIPEDIGTSLFAAPLKNPYLFKSTLGWHIFEVLSKRPAKTAPLEQVKQEIKSRLTTQHSKKILQQYREQNRLRAGVVIRHLNRPAEASHLDKACRVEIFEGIFDKKYSYSKE